ncbi:hypothetical protein ACJMK2_040060 [Sinanodonta woodiana]|uniref:Uncharacterized protein n=1 Tax=Sinanodonta woodiana TaxID=1069815 RepID=A0ABD3WH75_SINWO
MLHPRNMMLILFLPGFVLVVAATSCSDSQFQCRSGTCIDITDRCDEFPDCVDRSDETDGCGAECVLNDLKKFLYKDDPVKAVYRSGDTIRISCPKHVDYGYIYEYAYDSDETFTEVTCNNGSWVRYIPKCMNNADSSIKSTPTTDLADVTSTTDVDVAHYHSTSHASSESADCQLHGFSQYLIENDSTKKSYQHGQKINIACLQGNADDPTDETQQISSDSHSELTCHNGRWDGSYPECFKSCLPYVLKDFLVDEEHTMEEYRSGEQISVACSGNSADQIRYLTCLNGQWIGQYPECFVLCRRSSIQGNLTMETGSEYFLPGDVVQIKICWGNIPVEGDGHLTCMANGSWYGHASCPPQSDSDCLSPPDVQNAYILDGLQDRYPEGYNVTYKCEQDFWLRGNNKLTCINGKWTEEQFYCITRTCFYPGEIENGKILNITVDVGQYVHVSCDDGYILKGSHLLLCNAEGNLYSETKPTCEAVQCQPLRPPDHGWIDHYEVSNGRASNTYKSFVRIRCKHGYQLIGSERRQCQADRTWSGEDATCQKRGANCYRIPDVAGAMIEGKRKLWYAHGSTISYNCVENYIRTGNNQFACVDGHWMGGDMNCTRPICQLSSLDLRHGRFNGVDQMTIVHGDRISMRETITCNDGYTVPPNISYISCYNGTLDPPTFDCVKYDDSIRSCHLSKYEGKVIRYKDKCYLVTDSTFMYRKRDAATFCQILGPNAYLAIVPDKETNEAIRYLINMVPGEHKYWFGAMWNDDNSRWEWHDEIPLDYTNWKSGEGGKTSIFGKIEECAVFTLDGLWEDKLCRNFGIVEERYKAICEIAVDW